MADEQQQQPANSQPPAATGQQQPEPGPVPYERFKELADQHKALRSEWDKAQKAAQAAKEKELQEQQKWEQLYKERETELAKERQVNARLRVATTKGLPAELIDRLQGGTEEELAADADKLLALITPAEQQRQTPGVPPSRGSKPARLDISSMTPEEIRKNSDTLYRQAVQQ